MEISLIIFIVLLAAGAFIIYWLLKKVLNIIIWIIAIFIAYILLKLFVF